MAHSVCLVKPLKTLGGLNAHQLPADGHADTWEDARGVWRRTIGWIVVHDDGRIDYQPHHDTTPAELNILRGDVFRSAYTEQTSDSGWARDETTWATEVSAPITYARPTRHIAA